MNDADNPKSLSVVMISANFHPYIGGTEKQALELAKTLVALGIKVLVLTRHKPGLPKEETVQGILIRRQWAPGQGLMSSITFMGSIFMYLARRVKDFQILHVHLLSSHAVAAALIGKVFGKKVVIKLGGGIGVGEISLSRHRRLGRLKLRVIRLLRPTLVTVNALQSREILNCELSRLPVYTIPNGVDTRTYSPPDPQLKTRLRKILRWEGLVFLFAGRFSSDKKQVEVLETFLTGWAQACREGFLGSFYLVGEGPQKPSFIKTIENKGVRGNVHILEPRAQVQELFQAADVFVLPTISEGLSNALLEAMSTGLAILASRVPGTKEIVEEGIHGFLFDPYHPEEVRKALLRTAQAPNELSAMGSKARKLACDKFSIERTARAWIHLYKNLLTNQAFYTPYSDNPD